VLRRVGDLVLPPEWDYRAAAALLRRLVRGARAGEDFPVVIGDCWKIVCQHADYVDRLGVLADGLELGWGGADFLDYLASEELRQRGWRLYSPVEHQQRREIDGCKKAPCLPARS